MKTHNFSHQTLLGILQITVVPAASDFENKILVAGPESALQKLQASKSAHGSAKTHTGHLNPNKDPPKKNSKNPDNCGRN